MLTDLFYIKNEWNDERSLNVINFKSSIVFNYITLVDDIVDDNIESNVFGFKTVIDQHAIIGYNTISLVEVGNYFDLMHNSYYCYARQANDNVRSMLRNATHSKSRIDNAVKTRYLRSKRNFLFCRFINAWRHLLFVGSFYFYQGQTSSRY